MDKLKPCPVCGGWWKKPEPDPALATPDYVCVLCETQLWLTDEQRNMMNIVRTKENEFFFLPSNPTKVLPRGQPKRKSGGSSRSRGKKKGNKKYIEPWKLE